MIFERCFDLRIIEYSLHFRLTVVKVSFDGIYVSVLSHSGYHLLTLHLRYTAVRIEDYDLSSRDIAESLKSSLPSVS